MCHCLLYTSVWDAKNGSLPLVYALNGNGEGDFYYFNAEDGSLLKASPDGAAAERETTPVSYTHLDVYKRQDLNSRYRGINSETDVLSFPANDLEEPLCRALEKGLAVEKGETAEIALGDIYISVEKAIEQGSLYGNSPEEELGFLAVHGALHLMGYDHIEKEDEVIMRERQRKILGRAAE